MISRVSILPSPVTGLVQTVASAYYSQWKSHALGSDDHLLIQYGDESSWSLGENMFADIWLQTDLISSDVRIRSPIALVKKDAQISLQIFTAHVNFLKTVNFTAVSHTFTIAETGIPLDSLRTSNVTYSSNHFASYPPRMQTSMLIS